LAAERSAESIVFALQAAGMIGKQALATSERRPHSTGRALSWSTASRTVRQPNLTARHSLLAHARVVLADDWGSAFSLSIWFARGCLDQSCTRACSGDDVSGCTAVCDNNYSGIISNGCEHCRQL